MFEELVPLIIKIIAYGGIAVMGFIVIWMMIRYLKGGM